jgi:hypothetical protein
MSKIITVIRLVTFVGLENVRWVDPAGKNAHIYADYIVLPPFPHITAPWLDDMSHRSNVYLMTNCRDAPRLCGCPRRNTVVAVSGHGTRTSCQCCLTNAWCGCSTERYTLGEHIGILRKQSYRSGPLLTASGSHRVLQSQTPDVCLATKLSFTGCDPC